MLTTISPTRTASSASRSGVNMAPVNFNPATHPIIAHHFFGIEPFHPNGQIATDVLLDIGAEGGEEAAQAAVLFGRP